MPVVLSPRPSRIVFEGSRLSTTSNTFRNLSCSTQELTGQPAPSLAISETRLGKRGYTSPSLLSTNLDD